MEEIDFGKVNSVGGLTLPTTVNFGPDGRLYVTEQFGLIKVFEVDLEANTGNLVETINLVQNIPNHDDDGSPNANVTTRQVTGLEATTDGQGNVVLYVTSSDPRIAFNFAEDGEENLDTNSGVITRLTQNGQGGWDAVDIIRGLPRSEENHSNNGMALDTETNTLYVSIGGNTNGGAPSPFFALTSEYALSASIIAVDLDQLNTLGIQTDSSSGRQYIYDLPTLDDPTVANDGVRETADGLDVNGPWGGNDGLNQAILPSNAPIDIYATGIRNAYELVLTEDGKLYTIDNGANNFFGAEPQLDENNFATNAINDGEIITPDSLHLIEQGGYYGHPNPIRSNQEGFITSFDDNAQEIATIPNAADAVPAALASLFEDGHIIDPSRYLGPSLQEESFLEGQAGVPDGTIHDYGESTNGFAEYNTNNFNGALQGALISVSLGGLSSVNAAIVNEDGTDAEVFELFTLASGDGGPGGLDIAVASDGSLWIAELFSGQISIWDPSAPNTIDPNNIDDDAIQNVNDPFFIDATNGLSADLFPGGSLVWDFKPSGQPGAPGLGGGITGLMINGTDDPAAFESENVKFVTAAGGGTITIEEVASGNSSGAANDAEFQVQTGFEVSQSVDEFTIDVDILIPPQFAGSNNASAGQEIGAYIGTGDQSNFLKIVAVGGQANEIEVRLENNNNELLVLPLNADNIFSGSTTNDITFTFEVSKSAETVIPKVTYFDAIAGQTQTVTGAAVDISNTNLLDVIQGDFTVENEETGLAVGMSTSNGDNENTFQATLDQITVDAENAGSGTVLFRVNAGGPEIAALDDGPNWVADEQGEGNESQFITDKGSDGVAFWAAVEPGNTIDSNVVPGAIFDSERFDEVTGETDTTIKYAFDVAEGDYEVRIYISNGFPGTTDPEDRIFDIAVEGLVQGDFDDVDPVALFGNETGGVITQTVNVTDGTLNIEFLQDVIENPAFNAIEIVALNDDGLATISLGAPSPSSVVEGGDTGTTDLVFPITADADPGGDVTVSYTVTVGGVEFDTGTVALTGEGDNITVSIPNDDLDNGDENIVVTLTGVTVGDDLASIGSSNTAAATVTEDDGEAPSGTVLFRVNVGGPEVAAIDGGPAWGQDLTGENNSPFLVDPGSDFTFANANVVVGPTIDAAVVPGEVLQTERFDLIAAENDTSMKWAFDVSDDPTTVLVNIYTSEGFNDGAPGERVFDIDVEGVQAGEFTNVDPLALFGFETGGVISQTVTVLDGELNLEFLHQIDNPAINAIEIIELDSVDLGPQDSTANADAAFAAENPDMPDGIVIGAEGEVKIEVLPGEANVQASSFVADSFTISNTGEKEIAAVYFDLSTATLSDAVFDPVGDGGDEAFKDITIDTDGGVGFENSNFFQDVQDGGHRGAILTFTPDTDGGFQPGESVSFSVDADPKSIDGFTAGGLAAGSVPAGWDVGGISGAELIGATVTVKFTDGTTGTAQLLSDGSQAGSQTLISQTTAPQVATLDVDGLGAPGEYGGGEPVVTVTGPAGATVRVVMQKGFQPVETPESDATTINDRLATDAFMANNVIETQIVDVVLDGSGNGVVPAAAFDYNNDPNGFAFEGNDKLNLAYVAAVIDTSNDNLPLGPLTAPVYLKNNGFAVGDNVPPIGVDDDATLAEDDGATVIDVLANDTDANNDDLEVLSIDDTGATGTVTLVDGVVSYNPDGQFDDLEFGDTANDSFTYVVSDGEGGSDTATVNVVISGVQNGNAAPVAIDDTATVGENAGATVIDVLANDTDADEGDTLTVVSVDDTGTTGTVTLVNGEVSYDPNGQFASLGAGETATDTFTYVVSDSKEDGTDTATVTVTITGSDDPANTAPSAVNDTATIGEGAGATVINVLGNDTDADDDTLTVASINASGATGLVTLVDGVVSYNPNGQFDDLADGETATDTFSYVVEDGNGGSDSATVTVTITGSDDSSQVVIAGDSGDNEITGNALDNEIFGRFGDDDLSGGGGDDIVIGGNGNDTVSGDAGDDELNGGAGDDTVSGGAGNDTVRGNSGDDVVSGGDGDDLVLGGGGDDLVFGGAGNDTVIGQGGNDLVDGGAGDDTLFGRNGDDEILGGAGDDMGFGGSGNDDLDGGAGDDSLRGNDGDDNLVGGTGADLLIGGLGDDTMAGGEGDDILEGFLGADSFVFGTESGFDVVRDFAVGEDTLDFSARGVMFEDLTITEVNDGLRVTEGDLSVQLRGLSDGALSEDDFIF